MPFFEITKFYSRQQGNIVYNFYFDKNKQLVAEIVRDGNTHQLQADIPRDLQVDLDEEKISTLRMMFDQSYFGTQCDKILVNARGLGGWGDAQHDGSNNGAQQDGEGTYTWARSAGFSHNDAYTIAQANKGVDGIWGGLQGETAPAPISTSADFTAVPQGWHFNVFARTPKYQQSSNGSCRDSRINYALDCLLGAITLAEQEQRLNSLQCLGRGLHPLQDTFAHTSAFITCATSDGKWSLSFRHLYSHPFFPSSPADDPRYINGLEGSPESRIREDAYFEGHIEHLFNQRYSDTKTITLIYLFIYKNALHIWSVRNGMIGNALTLRSQLQALWSIVAPRLQTHLPTIDAFTLGGTEGFLATAQKKNLPIPNELQRYLPIIARDEEVSRLGMR